MQFWPISLQNRLKMCAFLRGITWATGRHENRLQPVHATDFFIFEESATATEKLVLIGPVQSSFGLFFGCMDRTCIH